MMWTMFTPQSQLTSCTNDINNVPTSTCQAQFITCLYGTEDQHWEDTTDIIASTELKLWMSMLSLVDIYNGYCANLARQCYSFPMYHIWFLVSRSICWRSSGLSSRNSSIYSRRTTLALAMMSIRKYLHQKPLRMHHTLSMWSCMLFNSKVNINMDAPFIENSASKRCLKDCS